MGLVGLAGDPLGREDVLDGLGELFSELRGGLAGLAGLAGGLGGAGGA